MLVQERVKTELARRGISQREAARQMGMSSGNLSDIVRGKRGISAAVALKMEVTLGLKAQELLELQSRQRIAQVRNGNHGQTDE